MWHSARFQWLLLWLVLGAVSACSPDLALSSSGNIACEKDSDCPAGLVCGEAIGRCIKRGAEQAPSLSGEAKIVPARGKVGTEFTISFEVPEELFDDPQVMADLGGTKVKLTGGMKNGRFEYRYKVKKGDPEGSHPVSVTLVAKSSAVSPPLEIGNLVFDFTAPEISGDVSAPTKEYLNAGASSEIGVTVTEELSSTPLAETDRGEHLEIASQSGLVYTFRRTATGQEKEGPAAVLVRFTDLAGNTAEKIKIGEIHYDFTPPKRIRSQVPTGKLRGSASFEAEIAFDEPLTDEGTAIEAGLAGAESVSLAATRLDSTTFLLSGVTPRGHDGTYQVKIVRARDRAGNEIMGEVAGSVEVDSTAPGFKGEVTVTPDSSLPVGPGADVQVSFEPSEALDESAGIMATLGGVPMLAGKATGSGIVYTAKAGFLDGKREPAIADGFQEITVEMQDVAGNRATLSAGRVRFDFTAPGLASSAVVPSQARPGVPVTVTVVASEALKSPPVLKSTPTLAFKANPGKSQPPAYVYEYTTASTDPNAEIHFAVDLNDVAGNAARAVALPESLRIDGLQPQVKGKPTLTPELVSPRDTVTLKFAVNKPVSVVSAVIGGKTMTVVGPASGTAFHYTYQPSEGQDVDGEHEAIVNVRDAVGNEAALQLGKVIFDVTAPRLVNPLFSHSSSNKAKGGDTIVLQLPFSEDIPAGPQIEWLVLENGAEKATPWRMEQISPPEEHQKFEYNYAVSSADAMPASYSLRVSAKDRAGNELNAPVVFGPFVVDGATPALTAVKVTPERLSAVAGFNTTTITFSCADAVEAQGGSVGVRVAGKAATCGPRQTTAPNYTCTYKSMGDEPEGLATVVASVADGVGNTGTATQALTFDFTPPGLASKLVTPQTAKEGATMRVSLTATEALSKAPVLKSAPAIDLGAAAQEGLTYIFSRAVTGSDPTGEITFSADMTDAAGNAASGLALGKLSVDRKVPGLSGTPSVSPATLLAKEGTTIAVTFTVDKALAKTMPPVTIGGKTMNCSGAYPTFTCTYTAKPADGDGVKPITIELEDNAGHVIFANAGSLTFDFKPPGLLTGSASPAAAKSGDEVFYTVTPSEPLSAAPVLAISGAGSPAFAYQTGTSYVFKHTVGAGDADGAYTAAITMTDMAGNTATSLPGTGFTFDASVPTISNLSADRAVYSAVAGFNAVTATFTAAEDVGDTPPGLVATIGGNTMSCSHTGTAPAVNYTCAYAVAGSEGDGIKTILVNARDAAGNMDFASASAQFDFTAPVVIPSTIRFDLLPPTTSLVQTVSKASHGTTIRLSFATNEILAEDPTVTTSAPETLNFDFYGGGDVSFIFQHTLTADTHAQGGYTTRITAADPVGNFSQTDLAPSLTVDTDAPSAVDATTPGRTIYERIPWGSEATAGFALFRAVGSAGAAEPQATVIVSDAPSLPWASLGTKEADVAGAFAVPLGTDVQHVYATAVDAAGNCSPTVAVTEHQWTATLGGKIPGDSTANPHFPGYQHQSLGSLLAPTTTEIQTPGALARLDANPVLSPSLTNIQQVAAPLSTPAARYNHALAYDSAQGKVVLFGGSAGGNETWEWDGNNWTLRTPINKPNIHYDHAMAYDSARGVVVVFGGQGSGFYDETWEWDGNNWILKTPVTKPSARYGHAMAYDSARGVTVLYGGERSGYKDETWEWDGKNWTLRNPATRPSSRSRHAMAYDDARGVTVLFGGYQGFTNNETWEWDGNDWTMRNPATKPSKRRYHTMAYDSARGTTVLFGGDTGSSGSANDETWEWNGNDWHLRDPAVTPPKLVTHAMTYDSARGVAILFGGSHSVVTNETWEWNGTNWGMRNPATKPSARSQHALAYDSVRGVTVLFGCSGGVNDNETWEWDDNIWTLRDPETKPPGRANHAMAYDSARGVSVLFGGSRSVENNETWEWNGTNWGMRNPATKPSARSQHALAFDSTRGVTVLFGGYNLGTSNNETWEWDGNDWTLQSPATKPTARYSHTMAYDSVRGVTVLFGGQTSVLTNETWEWDGNDWKERNPTTKPSTRWYSELAYDSARGVSVLFGGFLNVANNETWKWDGNNWSLNNPSSKPSARQWHAVAYNSARGVTVLFGGTANGTSNDETWEWDGNNWTYIELDKPRPGAHAAAAWIPGERRAVFFGGEGASTLLSDTWLFRGGQWAKSPKSPSPPARSFHAIASDPSLPAAVLFGGCAEVTCSSFRGDTWRLQGSTWTELFPTQSPSARAGHSMSGATPTSFAILAGGWDATGVVGDSWTWNGADWSSGGSLSPVWRHAMALDESRGKVVVFGGCADVACASISGDTWLWDGASWSQASPGISPPARYDAAMDFDAGLGAVVLWGGRDYAGVRSDAWAYNGTDWIELVVSPAGPARAGHVVFREGDTGRLILFGGEEGTDELTNSTWALTSGGKGRPGQIFRVNLGAAGWSASDQILGIDAFWRAGGLGHESGVPTPGADLLAWRAGAWRELATNNASAQNPDDLVASITNPVELFQTIFGAEPWLNFAVAPASPSGLGPAADPFGKIASDYVEVTVKYRRP